MLGTKIAEFNDLENGVRTEVWKVYSNGGYNYYVHTIDADSGNKLPSVLYFTDEQRAISRAKSICEGVA